MNSPFAVFTGASGGIGFALAGKLAEHGYGLVLAAEDDEFEAAAARARGRGTRVTAVRVDLAELAGVEELVRRIGDRPVDVLVLNAGIGIDGEFAGDATLGDQLKVVDRNVRSTVHLAATAPGPYQAVYSASKAFLTSFAEGIPRRGRRAWGHHHDGAAGTGGHGVPRTRGYDRHQDRPGPQGHCGHDRRSWAVKNKLQAAGCCRTR
ncbi:MULTISPECIES: SDR family oxidoreductase [Amycolatopsis]|uniref:SDR family NAD(P)-dependent oxidoreductase n=1 Tax=Amycolatopsis TaxID=1813 RepID=UPI0007DF0836|nr:MULTISPECIES: SDR family NAD(P)-dependent oxidoreductase [Amycolatopsis]OAP20860.1 1-deoxy-11-beta-hydroxypentalenate dehydrogenase [Amycolatopsis sp. M39]